MPVFSKQFYSDMVAENIELHSPLSVAIQAESPLGRKLIYSIVKGNEMEEFTVDFNTGRFDMFAPFRRFRRAETNPAPPVVVGQYFGSRFGELISSNEYRVAEVRRKAGDLFFCKFGLSSLFHYY